jgi:hypothetical protein
VTGRIGTRIAFLVVAAALAVGCRAPAPPPPPPPPTPVIPPPGDYKVTGLRAPLAGLGGPAEGGGDARVLAFSGSRGGWRCEQVRWDEQGRATHIFVVVGIASGASAVLDWSLVTASEGKPHERFTGKLRLRALDRRRVEGVLTFDEIPGRQDRVMLERLEDPLSGE